MSKNTEDYVWALQRVFNLLRADFPIGALAKLPAGGNECEALIQEAVDVIREVLEPDDIPAPKPTTAADAIEDIRADIRQFTDAQIPRS